MKRIRIMLVVAAVAAPTASIHAQCAEPSRPLARSIDGIWGGVETVPLDINRPGAAIGGQRVAITFFRGGRVLMRQPPEGLREPLQQTNAPNWSSDWGTYEVIGGREIRVNLPGRAVSGCWNGEVLRLRRGARTGIYRPWPRLTGPMDGSYRGAAEYPSISFSRNGEFVDEGFQQYLGDLQSADGGVRFSGSPAERRARAAGRGQYALQDNTLELRYDDGRVARFTALAAPDEARSSPVPRVMIAGQFLERHGGWNGGESSRGRDGGGSVVRTDPANRTSRNARCGLPESEIRASRAADGIYFARQSDGGVAAITLIGDGTLIDGRPPAGGLNDASSVAAAVAERRRARPVEIQEWAPAERGSVVLCGSGGRFHDLRVEGGGARLTGALGTYLRAPDPASAQLEGVVWQAMDSRDRFTGIQFNSDGRFKESNVMRYLQLPGARGGDRTGRWRMAGRYTLELTYDDTGSTERITTLMDPFENPAARTTLYLNQQPFTARR